MSFPHEVIAALPTAAPADKELLRALLTRRFAYCLADDELAADFVAKDPVSSIPPLNLIQGGTLFAYDETDTTTSASAVCLVTNDACRYKSGAIEPPDSVLTYSTTAQPADVDVSDGDTFLLPIAATGADWAGKAGQIAIRVGAKWHFAINPIGRKLYVEDEDTFYYRNDAGVWTAGNGANEFAASSIPITAIIGAKASFVLKVENQTTNAPPASPVAPVAYIIGPSPTGAWAGLAGQLAICLVNGAYTVIVPAAGDEVFDKALGINVKFKGSAWVSAAGAVLGYKDVYTQGTGSIVTRGSGGYNYATTNFPLFTQNHDDDDVTLSYTAKAAGNILILRYSALFSLASGTIATAAVGRDSVSTSLDFRRITFDAAGFAQVDLSFRTTAADASAHTYKVGLWSQSSPASVINFSSHRHFSVTEYTP